MKKTNILIAIVLSVCMLVAVAFAYNPRYDAYDTNIYNAAKVWHGKMSVDDFAVLLKAHCKKESNMQPYVTRNEEGYFTGRYQSEVTRTAHELQKWSYKNYGVYQSIYTWRIDLSKSYGLGQIMLQRAYELGWRGYSVYDPIHGLLNIDTGLYYCAKLINLNLKRYNYDVHKAISAYNAGSYTTHNNSYTKDVELNEDMFGDSFAKF